MTALEQPCSVLININLSETPSEQSLKQDFENGSTAVKIQALKNAIIMMQAGEKMPGLLMHIIRYVLPEQDHTIKKLMFIFWEIVPKRDAAGKLLTEMILVCDAYRKDLIHPNEFIRGSTLRFLCKVREPELLEPLMPSIRACLENKYSYVRRNAVLALYTIYRNFEFLVPDAPELIQGYLEGEQDPSCKRNAFIMLIHTDQQRALTYLQSCIDEISTFGDILQLVIVELIYKVCQAKPTERAKFIRTVYNLLGSSSASVRYEAAGTLVTLSSTPTAVKAAAKCYVELIVHESDNNVKLVVLDKLVKLQKDHSHDLTLQQELSMDVLRILGSTDIEVRRKTLDFLMSLISLRNVKDVVSLLKKEVIKTYSNTDKDQNTKTYQQLLVKALHQCGVKFPITAEIVVPVLMDFLAEGNEKAAESVLEFVREAVARFENLQPSIIEKLLNSLPSIKSISVLHAGLWILGEYCTSESQIRNMVDAVLESIGDLPIVDTEIRESTKDDTDSGPTTTVVSSSRVTADGTYATQSAVTVVTNHSDDKPQLRSNLLEGEFFLGAALATALTKLSLRYQEVCVDPRARNKLTAQSMLILASIMHLGKSSLPKKPISDDDVDWLSLCIRVLNDRSPILVSIFTRACRQSLQDMIGTIDLTKLALSEAEKDIVKTDVDALINFSHILSNVNDGQAVDELELSLLQATEGSKKKDTDVSTTALSKVYQLTGFSDPIYAEAYINVNQYDIVLDVLVVNQTPDTLQNLTLELATLGDLKLVDKPSPITLAGNDFCNTKAQVKVASTETGIIFGNIVYDVSGVSGDKSCVVLNDIHIDIMDYIVPATCTDTEFRKMWAEFEWENKVSVQSNINDMNQYLDHILKCTNMRCLTPKQALEGDCGFLAANLYAKSVFGEDALANISIEKMSDSGALSGHIRIRAKSQGMALSLGDKITHSQKKEAGA